MKRLLVFTMLINCVLSAKSQEVNRVIFDEAANQDILYGCCKTDAFLLSPFDEWFAPEHDSYSPDPDVLAEIKELIGDADIRIILGTWCGDSRREVPRFIKLLETIDFPSSKLDIICVNRGKTAEDVGVEKGYVDFVPTFIISHNQHEVGRIIEEPIESLEKDLLAILKKN